MKKLFQIRFFGSQSDNLESKTCPEQGRRIQNRKWLRVVASVVALTLCWAVVHAQQEKKVSRIGYLSDSNPARESVRSKAIGLALRELGYTEGQNITTEYRYAEGKLDRAPELAAELVRLNVDIIVIAGGDTQSRAAKNASKTIPIILTGDGADPVEAGLVESLARPGGNVTGITLLNRKLGGKRLELLKEAVPKIARVAVLYDPANPNNERELKEVLPVAARALGLIIQPWQLRDANGLEKEFAAMGSRVRMDSILPEAGKCRLSKNKSWALH